MAKYTRSFYMLSGCVRFEIHCGKKDSRHLFCTVECDVIWTNHCSSMKQRTAYSAKIKAFRRLITITGQITSYKLMILTIISLNGGD